MTLFKTSEIWKSCTKSLSFQNPVSPSLSTGIWCPGFGTWCPGAWDCGDRLSGLFIISLGLYFRLLAHDVLVLGFVRLHSGFSIFWWIVIRYCVFSFHARLGIICQYWVTKKKSPCISKKYWVYQKISPCISKDLVSRKLEAIWHFSRQLSSEV